jgi:glutamate 5-kinase
MQQRKCLVAKMGSSSITGEAGPDPHLLAKAVKSAILLRDRGWDLVLVSSGAVSSGRRILSRIHDRPGDGDSITSELKVSRRLAAAVGQPVLQSIYRDVASTSDDLVCQILIGEDDLRSPTRVNAIARVLSDALTLNIIPIVNGNDAVDSEGSDNDAVAAAVATMCDAQLLLLLTDTDGVYLGAAEADYAKLLKVDELYRVTSSKTGTGKGGIRSKLRAAELAALNGISTRIAAAKSPDIILRSIESEAPGTLIPAVHLGRAKSVKFSMITVSRGNVVVNREAQSSIQKGSSLFSSGIKRVSGSFVRGDVINVSDPSGRLLARGVTNVSASLLNIVRALARNELAMVLLAILERLADVPTSALKYQQDPRAQFGLAVKEIDGLSQKSYQSLATEVLTLFPAVAAQIMTAGDTDLRDQIERVSKGVGELAIVNREKLEVMPRASR